MGRDILGDLFGNSQAAKDTHNKLLSNRNLRQKVLGDERIAGAVPAAVGAVLAAPVIAPALAAGGSALASGSGAVGGALSSGAGMAENALSQGANMLGQGVGNVGNFIGSHGSDIGNNVASFLKNQNSQSQSNSQDDPYMSELQKRQQMMRQSAYGRM